MGDMAAAFPESIERAEAVLRRTKEMLGRTKDNVCGSQGSLNGAMEGNLTVEVGKQTCPAHITMMLAFGL